MPKLILDVWPGMGMKGQMCSITALCLLFLFSHIVCLVCLNIGHLLITSKVVHLRVVCHLFYIFYKSTSDDVFVH